MTYYDLIEALKQTALEDPNIRFAGAGDIYELNNLPDLDYRIFYITPNLSTGLENVKQYSLNLYYIDRWDDTQNNQIEIQSAGVEILTNIINRFQYKYPVQIQYPFNIQFFYQKFKDVTAGCYFTITFTVDSDVCLIGETYED